MPAFCTIRQTIIFLLLILFFMPHPATAKPRPAVALVHLLLPPDKQPAEAADWVRALDKARDALEARHIATVVSTSLPDDFRVFQEVADMEPEILFATSPQLAASARKLAEASPDTTVFACTDETANGNMNGLHIRTYEAHYLAGMLAGMLSQSGVLGYLANNPYQSQASRQRNANAFTLGAQASKPDIRVFYAPGNEPEKELATLLTTGADIVDLEQMRPNLSEHLRKRAVRYVGRPEHPGDPLFLVAPEWEWESLFGDLLTQVRFGLWRTRNVSYGMREGVVRLSGFGPSVPQSVQERMQREEKKLRAGVSPFKGPITDASGTLRITADDTPEDSIRSMDWNVRGLMPLPDPVKP